MNWFFFRKLFLVIVFSTIISGCMSFPVFENTLVPVSRKHAGDLVKSSWISCDEDNRLVLSFVSQSGGNYLTVFRKTEISNGKLDQETYVIPGVVSKAGNKRFLFIKAIDPNEDSRESKDNKQNTKKTVCDGKEICLEKEICIEKEEKPPLEEAGYMVFYYDIVDDILNLHLLENEAVLSLVEKGMLQGTITESKWSKSVRVSSDSRSLKKVLTEVSIEELLGDGDLDNVKSFKRKN